MSLYVALSVMDVVAAHSQSLGRDGRVLTFSSTGHVVEQPHTPHSPHRLVV